MTVHFLTRIITHQSAKWPKSCQSSNYPQRKSPTSLLWRHDVDNAEMQNFDPLNLTQLRSLHRGYGGVINLTPCLFFNIPRAPLRAGPECICFCTFIKFIPNCCFQFTGGKFSYALVLKFHPMPLFSPGFFPTCAPLWPPHVWYYF